MKISESSTFTILHEHFVSEKAVFKVGAAFVPSQLKTITYWQFRALFATASTHKKRVFAWICDNEWNMDPPLQSGVKFAAGESRPKRPKMLTSVGKVFVYVFYDAQRILFINYLEKGWTINREYYIGLLVCLKETSPKNGHKWRRKKYSFTKKMHCVTSWSQWWKNYMNGTPNCFWTHPILPI